MEEEEEEEDKKRERQYFCRRDFLTQYKAPVAKKNMIKLCVWVPILREERSEEVGPYSDHSNTNKSYKIGFGIIFPSLLLYTVLNVCSVQCQSYVANEMPHLIQCTYIT